MRRTALSVLLTLLPSALLSQASKPATAVVQPALTESQQIASALLALPAQFRESARVLGYKQGSNELVPLREGGTGRGAFICLATPPGKSFHVACYQNTLEPFMRRGRELRAQGVKDDQVDTVRFAEVKSGKLAMPKGSASMYQIFGGVYDPAKGTVDGGRPLFVMYMPGATTASTGLSDKPVDNGPWLMLPGTPKAHMMLVPRM
jgi:hypothetical protein